MQFTLPAIVTCKLVHLSRSDLSLSIRGGKLLLQRSDILRQICTPKYSKLFSTFYMGDTHQGSQGLSYLQESFHSLKSSIYNSTMSFSNSVVLGVVDIGSEINNNKSSAYKESVCSKPHLWIPLLKLSYLSVVDNGLIATANNSRLKGHP